MLNPAIFREYDIRGAADAELLDADVETLGQAFGTYLQRHAALRLLDVLANDGALEQHGISGSVLSHQQKRYLSERRDRL